MKTRFILFGLSLAVWGAGLRASELRIGVIGLDTSHCIGFSRLLNDPSNPQHVPGGRIVAAYKGGSPDMERSASRIDGFTERMVSEFGVVLYDSIEEVVRNVDAVMILSVDGRVHLEQARRVMPFKKPLFIDKPLAASVRDAVEIRWLAERHGVPCFSSSSLRYSSGMAALKDSEIGELRSVFSTGPAEFEPNHPDLFWYGIHAVEALYAVMGRGCETVVRAHTPNTDVVTGVWSDGRVGIVHGARNSRARFRLTVFGSASLVDQVEGTGYGLLLAEVIQFFKTGIPPVSLDETIEILTFMEAADESKRLGGVPVSLAEFLKANSGTP